MCKTILSNNSIGCISYCYNQQIFSVAIGNVFINLNSTSLLQLKNAVKRSREELLQRDQKYQRVFLETPLENFFLFFNTNEINDCLDLFFDAEMELCYQNLLIDCGIV
jgi:hypothetical protein